MKQVILLALKKMTKNMTKIEYCKRTNDDVCKQYQCRGLLQIIMFDKRLQKIK